MEIVISVGSPDTEPETVLRIDLLTLLSRHFLRYDATLVVMRGTLVRSVH